MIPDGQFGEYHDDDYEDWDIPYWERPGYVDEDGDVMIMTFRILLMSC